MQIFRKTEEDKHILEKKKKQRMVLCKFTKFTRKIRATEKNLVPYFRKCQKFIFIEYSIRLH